MVEESPPTQRRLVQRTLLAVAPNQGEGRVETTDLLDRALAADRLHHEGHVFHQGETPRASARRALYELLDANTLLVRDGRGYLRFRTEDLADVILQATPGPSFPSSRTMR